MFIAWDWPQKPDGTEDTARLPRLGPFVILNANMVEVWLRCKCGHIDHYNLPASATVETPAVVKCKKCGKEHREP